MNDTGWLMVAGLLSTISVLSVAVGMGGLRWVASWWGGSKHAKLVFLLVWFLTKV
jgi:hypothetical protein